MSEKNFISTFGWYADLSNYTFPTLFVKLKDDEIKALAAGETQSASAKEAEKRLKGVMAQIPGSCFVSTDSCAPTDTERYESKRGSTSSARSAWRYLAASEKVRKSASSGTVEYLVVRPFRRMSWPREFRCFIRGGKLVAMSQYHLVRHYRRLEGVKAEYYAKAKKFVDTIAWALPQDDLVMDIYFTQSDNIMIIDFNRWGSPTDPLLLRDWERKWGEDEGIFLIAPPARLSGDVNVSF